MSKGDFKKKAIFLDRDGTLNEDEGYVHDIKDFKLLPGVIEGLNLLKRKFVFFIVTNQSGIGRGFYSYKDFLRFNDHLINVLKSHEITILKTYVCPHKPDENCDCRKPNPTYLYDARDKFSIDLEKSWVIGDHPSDVLLGKNAGSHTIYLLTGHGKEHVEELTQKKIEPTLIASNFLKAAKEILQSIENNL